MDRNNDALVRRQRASVACNACRKTKSRCDGMRPVCERCSRLNAECVYSQNTQDKRLNRQVERRANLELRSRVAELESRLAATTSHPDDAEHSGSVDARISDLGTSPGLEAERNHPSQKAASAAGRSEPESVIDVLAAGVFDHPSAQSSICYFGASSNHSLFWSLTATIANLGHRKIRLFQEPLRQIRANEGPLQLPRPQPSCIGEYYGRYSSIPGSMPDHETAISWIARFFDTVGAVLPYISESAVTDSLERVESSADDVPAPRSVQALLYIVFAHSLSVTNTQMAEPFYLRTLSALDPRTLYTPSIELLQALLLVSSFQQNSQRSTESLTTHALAVKSAYHLGVHAPSSYGHLTPAQKEVRSRLWFAVINQDRMLSSALGQPCLIPAQHIRMEILDLIDSSNQQRTLEMQYPKEDLEYFRNLVALHEIMGTALDSLCGSNIDPSFRLEMPDLLGKTLELSLRLESWLNEQPPSTIITSETDVTNWTPTDFEVKTQGILLSIYYYRTMLLVHGPLLMTSLEKSTHSKKSGVPPGVHQNTISGLLQNDLRAVQDFGLLISGIMVQCPSFFKKNTAWWTCNYGALTISLHMFAFWLASGNTVINYLALGHDSSDLEMKLRGCLDRLRAIGASSAMSVKAHRCLQRHLDVLSNKGSHSTHQGPHETTRVHLSALPGVRDHLAPAAREYQFETGAGYSGDGIAEFLQGQHVASMADLDLFGLELGVSDFDAAGLI
uniref:Zn(2)-C6 fungal-type domain-containing protein n=1 Tax=Bionectria ochroleuca TaxID=29856 RepID=A0A0B7KKS7_BIOOC